MFMAEVDGVKLLGILNIAWLRHLAESGKLVVIVG
jgi:hypothetical protein